MRVHTHTPDSMRRRWHFTVHTRRLNKVVSSLMPPSSTRSALAHPLEHPLPLDRDLVRRAQELAHPLHHVAQLGGARGRAVGLCVLEPRGDRLGLEGGLVLRRMLRLRCGEGDGPRRGRD